jgi:predicted nuclease of predicted toxin-antitoxin system
VASFVVDEDMSQSLARLLREAGHDAVHVRDVGLRGAPDVVVLRFAQDRGATLITEDIGFGDLRQYPLGSHAGIILLLIREELPYSFHNRRAMQVIEEELEAGLTGCLLVVDATTVRRREP